jgi:Flp pilus assembly protein TadD
LLDAKMAEEAVPLLTRAVELRKDVPEFQNNLGMALEHTGQFKAAAVAYADAVVADPGYDKAKQNLARVEAIK